MITFPAKKKIGVSRPLDSGAASSAACWQGKKDIGRSRKKKEKKEKKGKKEE